MAPESKSERSPLFYGWYILAASFVILFFNAGARSIKEINMYPMEIKRVEIMMTHFGP